MNVIISAAIQRERKVKLAETSYDELAPVLRFTPSLSSNSTESPELLAFAYPV